MTTGRINQVAFLRDAAPRPRAAGAVGGAGAAVIRCIEVLLGPGRESSPTACAGSESAARPRGPRDRRGFGGTRGVLRCPPAPVGGRRMEAFNRQEACFPLKGRQHKNQPLGNHTTPRDRRGSPAGRSVDGHGASRQRRSKHHSHAHAFLPSRRLRGIHTPQPVGVRADGSTGGAGPTPLGVKHPTTLATTFPRPWHRLPTPPRAQDSPRAPSVGQAPEGHIRIPYNKLDA